LRAFAVFAVLVGHFTPAKSGLFLPLKLIDLGGLGVRPFCISGFLITGIVLKSYCKKDHLAIFARRVLQCNHLLFSRMVG